MNENLVTVTVSHIVAIKDLDLSFIEASNHILTTTVHLIIIGPTQGDNMG